MTMHANADLPAPQGLYDPRFEHDACGVSFVANVKGVRSHDIVRFGIGALCNMEHRGATGAEAGFLYKLKDQLLVNASAWWLDMQQEFVYVGDAGVVEPSGRSVRTGLDIGLRWQPLKWLFVDADYNLARPRGTGESGQLDSYIPLAPLHTSIGGVTVLHKGFSGSLRYRYLGDRPANEDNSLNAEGYLLFNTVLQYETRRFQFGGSVDNLLNTLWKEAQFETESRLQGEAQPVSEIHFTPGTPRAWRLWVGFKF